MKINEFEFEFDIYDLNNAEKYEKEIAKVLSIAENSKNETSVSKAVKIQCNAIFSFFNNLFGKGTDKKIFGEKINLVDCLSAYKTFIEYVLAQKSKIKELSIINKQ